MKLTHTCASVLPIVVAGMFASVFAGSDPVLVETSVGIPIAKIKESIICCPLEEITLDGWASIDVAGEVAKWLWDLNGDRRADTTAVNGTMTITAPADAKSYRVYLWVKDNQGNISSPDSATVCVMAGTPHVNVGPDTTLPVSARISFDAKVESSCSKPVHYEWDFNDDGKPEYKSDETPKTSRVYYKPGKYFARLTVTDNLGKQVGAIKTINVDAIRD